MARLFKSKQQRQLERDMAIQNVLDSHMPPMTKKRSGQI